MSYTPKFENKDCKSLATKLAVITVNYHSTKLINEMEEMLRPLLDVCLIVVDNSNNFVSNYSTTVVLNSANNIGFGKACNLGALYAKAKYLLFLNPDTLISPRIILDLISCVPPKSHSIWSPTIENNRGKVSTLSVPGRFGLNYRRGYLVENKSDNSVHVHYVSGACMMIRKDFFNEIGGFDPNIFLYAEDLDLCARAKDMGADIIVFTHLRVRHAGGNSTSDWKSKFLRLFRSWVGHYVFFRKYKNPFLSAINAAHLASGLHI